MTPLLMLTMYEVPVFSLLLNLFITALLTVLLCCAFIVTVIGSISSLGSIGSMLGARKLIVLSPFVDISSGIIGLYRKLCRLMLRCPFSVIISGHIEIWQAVLMYTFIIVFLVLCYRYMQKRPVKRGDMKRRLRLTIGYILCSLSISFAVTAVGKFYNITGKRVVFLDVGQGDGSIIRSSAGRNYIIDCGSSSKASIGKYTLIPALKYYGMDHIDAVFLSHTDTDHVSGIIELLELKELYGISVGKVIIAEGTEEDENLRLIEKNMNPGLIEKDVNLKLNEKNKQNLIEVRKGQMIDGCFEVIYPVEAPDKETDTKTEMKPDTKSNTNTDIKSDTNSDIKPDTKSDAETDMTKKNKKSYGHTDNNENSLVVLYHDKDVQVLYTGDISSEIEQKLLDDLKGKEKSRLRILKCPHHGSRYSCSKDLLETYSPDITVISVGKNNYGHPHDETLKRLDDVNCRVYRTDNCGCVIIEMK